MRGKFFVVAREKGKFVSTRKWSRKDNLQQGKRTFKETGTLYKNVRRVRLVNVVEVVDTREVVKRPKGKVQYVIKANFGKGKVITARSQQVSQDVPIEKIKKEAKENLDMRIGSEFQNQYDSDVGQQLRSNLKPKITQGVVYYRARA